MKRFLLLFTVIMSTIMVYGQNQKARERIEAARIALITKELNLTPDQAKTFWPIYNEFMSKRNDLVRKYKIEKANFDHANATEEDRKRLVNRGLELKQQKLNLEKDYSDRLLSIISSRQIIRLKGAEDKFRRMVLERLQKRQDQQNRTRQEQLRNRRDDFEKRKRNN